MAKPSPEDPESNDPLEVVLKFLVGFVGLGLVAFFTAGRELTLQDPRLWWIVVGAAMLGGVGSTVWGSRFWAWLIGFPDE